MEKQPLAVEFGLVVRQFRKDAGLTQTELAERAHIHPNFVGFIERGERMVSLATAARLAEGLGTPLSQIFTLIEKKQC